MVKIYKLNLVKSKNAKVKLFLYDKYEYRICKKTGP